MQATKAKHRTPRARLPQPSRLGAGLIGRPLKKLLGLDRIGALYDDARGMERPRGAAFLDAALAKLEISVDLKPSLDEAPRTGALVIIANHPFGGVEGLALVRELMRVRPDIKVMANSLLARVVELNDFSIWVDPFGGDESRATNMRPMREALRHLRGGGALLVFPAGEVSHLQSSTRTVIDPAWQASTARLIRMTSSAVLPIYVEGRNSNLFQLAGLISPLLRTALLPRELLAQRATTLSLRVGRLLSNEDLHRYGDPRKLLAFLRLATYALANQVGEPAKFKSHSVGPAAIAKPANASDVEREIHDLPSGALLHSSLEFDVYCASAPEIPLVLHELGRLRETAFRAVGEGTGSAIDLDAYDEHYDHLFLWDRLAKEIVGAYRIGRTDRLLAEFGEHGVYTRSLFNYKRAFLNSIGPALELGRAFVTPSRQKSHLPLLLLWQGVGRYIGRHPQYTTLFGAVSISAAYSPVSRYVMARRLLATTAPIRKGDKRERPMGNLRLPRRSVVGVDLESLADLASNVEELGHLIAGIEPEGTGLPVLLRQYLKLNGRVLAFSVDESFGNSMDALLVVDLRESEGRVRSRVLGPLGEARFRLAHGLDSEQERPSTVCA